MQQQGPTPTDLDLKKDHGLSVRWSDGRESFYPVAHLRRLSPSADVRELRKAIEKNPLTVLPRSASAAGSDGLRATDAELVGNYAIRIRFSDGHSSGIYTWAYLREIDPDQMDDQERAPGDAGPRHDNPLGLGPGG